MGFIVERDGGFDFEFFPVTSDPCSFLDLATLTDPRLLPDDDVMAWVHTHPGPALIVVPDGACERLPEGSKLDSGPSPGDLGYRDFLGRAYPNRDVVGITLEADGVQRFTSDDPEGTKFDRCDVTSPALGGGA